MSALTDVQGQIATLSRGIAAQPSTRPAGAPPPVTLADALSAQVAAVLLVATQRAALQAAVLDTYNAAGIDAVVVALIAAEATITAAAATVAAAALAFNP